MNNEKITNCYSAENFYNKVKVVMKEMEKEYALVMLDFDNFNYINNLFGYEKGDITLSKMEECFSQNLRDGEIFSRIHADHFIFLVEKGNESLIERFLKVTDIKHALKDILPVHYSLICSGGIISTNKNNETLASLLDKVNFARKLAKESHTSTFLYYDQEMDEKFEWRKEMTLMMESGLHHEEFEMYLQPKMLLKTGEVIGAEALVRWNNKKYGMLSPDQFIPILEQNGFIKQIDFYMLEKVCHFLKEMMEQKMQVIPISVNFSKLHIQTTNFVEQVFEVVNRNGVPTSYIEIEFTENIIAEDFQTLIDITSNLKYLGFKVSLDDFGKAYSSLNYLKDLPLDIIKIDREFLNSTTNTDRGRLIIAKMVELIKSLRLVAVMEGVETEEQSQFLQKLGCDLGQGYLYAKPMPKNAYLEYLNKNKIACLLEKDKGNQEICTPLYSNDIPQEFQMDNWELYVLGQNIDIGLMKGFLDTHGTLQYINDRALQYFGYTRQEFREKFNNSIISFVHPDDLITLKEYVQLLLENEKPLSFQTRAIRKDGEIIYLQGNMSYIKDPHGHPIGIYCFQDITEELKRTKALHASEERYRFILEQSDDIVFEWDFETGVIDFSDKFEKVFNESLTQKWENNNIPLMNKIHPEDKEIFKQWVESTYQKAGFQEAEFRIANMETKYLWIRSRSTAICNESGEALKTIGVFSNIAKQKEEFNKLVAETQVDSLTKLYNKEEARKRVEDLLTQNPSGQSAFFIIDIDNFKEVNDSLGHQFGDTILQEIAQKIKRIFKDTDIIGRIGGDEIGVFMLEADSEETVNSRAELLNQVLRGTYFGTQTKYKISVSIGIAMYPQQSHYFTELYQMADAALSESKKKGKDCYTLYHSHMEGFEIENRTPLEGTERFLNNYFAEDIIFNTFEMLYETKDIQTTIRMILEQLGKRFQVDRVYIFEHSKDGKYISNTYEWCASGISSAQESLQKLSTEDFSAFLSMYDKEGILCCNDISTMDPLAFETLYRQGICSFLQCGIYNEGKMVGFVGFDDCYKKRNWYADEIAMLGYISRILSVFLIKNHTMRELLESYAHYVDMLDNLNGYVYVIDTKTYELLYMNNAMEALEANIGEKCYRVAFGCDTPCEKCPVKRLNQEIPYASEEIYSVRIDRWVNSAASRLRWNGTREAALICCTDISKYKG